MFRFFIFIISFLIFFAGCNPQKELTNNSVKKQAKTVVKKSIPSPFKDATAFSKPILWLRYPAISPDGKFIVFSYKGDIYKVKSSGGTAIPLTTNASFESQPVWSPDGKKIAFLSSRNGNFDIYIISANGGPAKRLTYHSAKDYPETFSPDGKCLFFSSARGDSKDSVYFPTRALPEFYKVAVDEDNPKPIRILSLPVLNAKFSKDFSKMLFNDKKGYENSWRKHHHSSITRDIWLYNLKTQKFTKETSYKGEDRNPVWANNDSEFFYLSERSGDMNVWKKSLNPDSKPVQISFFKKNPVRFLSISNEEKLAYSFNGEIYVQAEHQKPVKLTIYIAKENNASEKSVGKNIGEMKEFVLSPDGKEYAFVIHGEIYVASIASGTTKRITHTPQEERWLDFSPDGKTLLYSSERNGSWNIYKTQLVFSDEKYFFRATELKETPVIETSDNTFQAKYSPDGKKIAFIKNRLEFVVYDLKTRKFKTIVPKKKSFSYIDGDQEYVWSPDSKNLLVKFIDRDSWNGEIGIVPIDGSKPVFNITNSGYDEFFPVWKQDGSAVAWFSDQEGINVYSLFLNQKALDIFNMSKEDYSIYKELNAPKKDKNPSKTAKKATKQAVKPIKFDKSNISDRTIKLTLDTLKYMMFAYSKDGESLYLFVNAPKSYDIYSLNLREKKQKKISSIPHSRNQNWWTVPPFGIELSKDGKTLFILAEGRLYSIATASGKMKPLNYNAPFSVDEYKEREYMFNHVWKTMNDKFYETSLHNVDWKFYHDEYQRFLPHINNNFDFTEMLSEMLGELNVSHTGSGYIFHKPMGDSTAVFGAFYDKNYDGDGLKIAEIMEGSPLIKADSKIKVGVVIEKIDGNLLKKDENYYKFLNRKVGKRVRLSLFDPKTNKRWDEIVKPISWRSSMNLAYKRWVKRNEKKVDELSNGQLGYVHIRGMDEVSFIDMFKKVMGKFHDKKGLVVDTRFNGGGWLHNKLAIFLSGKRYTTFSPRGNKNIGGDPLTQWTKKSILLVGESNYSDAHFFAYTYQTLKLGSVVGMPVPGTATAVWWPNMLDESMYFGIPQVGVIAQKDGKYLENRELEPDYKVFNKPQDALHNKDDQLRKAVEVLLKQIKEKKSK